MVKWMVLRSGIFMMVPVLGFLVLLALRLRTAKLPKPLSSILRSSFSAFSMVLSIMSSAAVTSCLWSERSVLTSFTSSFFNMIPILVSCAKGSVRNNLVFSGRKCAAGSVDFIYSQPQRSWLREDCEYIKSTEDVVQLRIGKSKLFLSEP